MARPKAGQPTKASAIRDYLAANPKAKTKVVLAALAAQGIKASANHVYLIKSKVKGKKRRAKRVAATAVATRQTAGSGGNPAQMVTKVKQLAHEVGGLRGLKALVDALVE